MSLSPTGAAFRALVVEKPGEGATGDGPRVETWDEGRLAPDGVVLEVLWSGVNYKDALAASPTGRVARISPLVPGVDLVGRVVRVPTALAAARGDAAPATEARGAEPAPGAGGETSRAGTDAPGAWLPKPGEIVIAHGYEIGVSRHGGFAELASVPAENLVPLPGGLEPRDAMAIGTAGFTAALSVVALEEAGLTPGSGAVVVTGATGGVGSLALSILAARGYEVVASTGKADAAGWLAELGASSVVSREEVVGDPSRPLARERWAGAVDCVGGQTLAGVLRSLRYGAAVAASGLTGGGDLPTTVFPFILRGVSLLGIDSVETPMPRRRAIWGRLATDLRPPHLDATTTECELEAVPDVLAGLLRAEARGRTVVRLAGD